MLLLTMLTLVIYRLPRPKSDHPYKAVHNRFPFYSYQVAATGCATDAQDSSLQNDLVQIH